MNLTQPRLLHYWQTMLETTCLTLNDDDKVQSAVNGAGEPMPHWLGVDVLDKFPALETLEPDQNGVLHVEFVQTNDDDFVSLFYKPLSKPPYLIVRNVSQEGNIIRAAQQPKNTNALKTEVLSGMHQQEVRSQAQYARLLNQVASAVLEFDDQGAVVFANDLAKNWFNSTPGMAFPSEIHNFTEQHKAHITQAITLAKQGNPHTTWLTGLFFTHAAAPKPPHYLRVDFVSESAIESQKELSLGATVSHSVARIIAVISDETEMQARVRQYKELAERDALTGLPNRRAMLNELGKRLASTVHAQSIVCALLDLDKFKLINDSSGHAAGDHVLVAAAQRLKSAVRDTDFVCRLAGDEFLLVLHIDAPTTTFHETLKQTIANIHRRLCGPVVFQNQPLALSGTIGAAVVQSKDEPIDSILRRADGLMYAAKQRGDDFAIDTPLITF
jgi:diguanylate cyclase (GGDEF)-like protein